MGVWGTGLYSNDAAGDIRDACKDFYAFYDIETAHRKVAENFSEYFEGWTSADEADNDTASFWYALADWQFSHGVLSEVVKSRTLALLDIYAGLSEWEEDGSAKDVQKRREILDALKAKLLSEQPAPKVPKGRLKKPKHKPGDIIIFRTSDWEEDTWQNMWHFENFVPPYLFKSEILRNSPYQNDAPVNDAHGKYMALLCVGHAKKERSIYITDRFDEYSTYVWYDFEGDEKPTIEQLSHCGFLPHIRKEYVDVYTHIFESVDWEYAFFFRYESFRSQKKYYELFPIEKCADEVARFERAIAEKSYLKSAEDYNDILEAYDICWNEKVRAGQVGVKVDTLLPGDPANPELLSAEEATEAYHSF